MRLHLRGDTARREPSLIQLSVDGDATQRTPHSSATPQRFASLRERFLHLLFSLHMLSSSLSDSLNNTSAAFGITVCPGGGEGRGHMRYGFGRGGVPALTTALVAAGAAAASLSESTRDASFIPLVLDTWATAWPSALSALAFIGVLASSGTGL
mmetsp:Transcript_6797/g.17630  ORF Transcript_6797/g.17630 Transcript_6797/m.17630 type:complete len:154 (+) Transcript_6797:130-591(+)